MQRSEAHERDRQRLRRVLARAKELLYFFESRDGYVELLAAVYDSRRRSAAWKAAAKKWMAKATGYKHKWRTLAAYVKNMQYEHKVWEKHGLTQIVHECRDLKAERDELRRRLEEALGVLRDKEEEQ